MENHAFPGRRLVLPSGKKRMHLASGCPVFPEGAEKSLVSYFPFDLARLNKGETVLDLGCGGGADALKAARLVGREGRVYGVERSKAVLNLAEINKNRFGMENAVFIRGRLEEIPLPDGSADAVISNLVFHMVKDKARAMEEVFRVLKKGGRIAFADIACIRRPNSLRYTRTDPFCSLLGHTLGTHRYASILKNAGFQNIKILTVLNEAFNALLSEYLTAFHTGLHYEVWPVVVYAKKTG